MITFFASTLTKNKAILTLDEYRHCTKVLRHRQGDELWVTDGNGTLARGFIDSIDKHQVNISIKESHLKPSRQPGLHIAVSFPKSSSRVEFMLEKLVELGANEVSPLISHHSERKRINPQRLRKKIASAATQSGHTHFPILHELQPLKDFVAECEPSATLYCHFRKRNPQLINIKPTGKDMTIIIGPEGDFSQSELDLMDQRKIQSVNLGSYRLRTETAAIMACTLWRQISNERNRINA